MSMPLSVTLSSLALALFATSSSQAGLPPKARIHYPELAAKLDQSKGSTYVCGTGNLNPRAKDFKAQFLIGNTKQGYLIQGAPGAEALSQLLKLGADHNLAAELKTAFKDARLVLVTGPGPTLQLSEAPVAVTLRWSQTFGQCMRDGPQDFTCGQGVTGANCCEGTFKLYSLVIEWKSFDANEANLELDYRISAGTILHPKGHRRKGEVRFCLMSEAADFE